MSNLLLWMYLGLMIDQIMQSLLIELNTNIHE